MQRGRLQDLSTLEAASEGGEGELEDGTDKEGDCKEEGAEEGPRKTANVEPDSGDYFILEHTFLSHFN